MMMDTTMPRDTADFLPAKALIGMVHVGALPGTPFQQDSIESITEQAVLEAKTLSMAGFDAIMLENMHDRPYVHGKHGPEIVAAMTRVALAVRSSVDVPLGIQILSGGEQEALAVALASGAKFIRCENFVYAHVADEGLLSQAAAGSLLRYRRQIGAEHVRIMCDIKKKHASHALTGDLSITDCAHGAAFFGADGLIVTGRFTGTATDPDDLTRVAEAVDLPVWVGSGVTPEQLEQLFAYADALIVGSFIKHNGEWHQPVDVARCEALVKEANRLRRGKSAR